MAEPVEIPQDKGEFDVGDTERQDLVAETTPPLPRDPATGQFVSPAAVEPAPAAAKHPAYLTQQAEELGFSAEEVEEMSTGLLTRQIYRAQRDRHAAQMADMRARTLSEAAVRQPEPRPVQPIEEDVLPATEFDERLVSHLRKTEARLKAQEEELARLRQQDQAKTVTTNTELIDEAFEALGDEYAALVGKGAVAELNPQSPEIARRIAILNAAGINLQNVTRASKARIKAAADKLFPRPKKDAGEDSPYQAATGKPAKANGVSPEEWAEASLARPTQRKAAELPKGDKRAIANLEQKMRQEGGTAEDAEIMEGLLP